MDDVTTNPPLPTPGDNDGGVDSRVAEQLDKLTRAVDKFTQATGAATVFAGMNKASAKITSEAMGGSDNPGGSDELRALLKGRKNLTLFDPDLKPHKITDDASLDRFRQAGGVVPTPTPPAQDRAEVVREIIREALVVRSERTPQQSQQQPSGVSSERTPQQPDDWYPKFRDLNNRRDMLREGGKSLPEKDEREWERLNARLQQEAYGTPTPKQPTPKQPTPNQQQTTTATGLPTPNPQQTPTPTPGPKPNQQPQPNVKSGAETIMSRAAGSKPDPTPGRFARIRSSRAGRLLARVARGVGRSKGGRALSGLGRRAAGSGAGRLLGGLGKGLGRLAAVHPIGRAALAVAAVAGVGGGKKGGGGGGGGVADKFGKVAGATGKVISSLAEFNRALDQATRAALDTNRKFAEVSASMQAVFAERDVKETFRNMEKGERLAPSARNLARAEDQNRAATKEAGIFIQGVRNDALAWLTRTKAEVLLLFDPLFKAANKFMGYGNPEEGKRESSAKDQIEDMEKRAKEADQKGIDRMNGIRDYDAQRRGPTSGTGSDWGRG